MASSMISSAAVAAVNRTNPAQAAMVAPFSGLKSTSAFPVTKKLHNDLTSLPSNGGRVQCMLVWPTVGLKKFETLSYLPPMTQEALAREIDYLLRSGWIPCLEFDTVLCSVSTTSRRGTMTGGIGQCGSCPCMGAQTHLKC
ncbi:ribulose bisphosphate carboxylase small subunit, chloroplastic-like isoform X2 [Malania oleifera]|uniref:ribulose bisphosphate carboxylase small subunit, chloroplastic-like isoform X2 n=1 Tax=Malania oleifera TaxID=397392 RepID=UPI0025AEBF39|nr:ribulose bisphosphate carboxylase small subunit, chloroplastic-like isoform X2 [Malania oleifera]